MSALPFDCVTKMVVVAELIATPAQLARHDPERIKRLAEDMAAKGQLQPIGVTEDGRIIFGNGRYAAARLLGWKTIEAKVYPKTISETQFKTLGLCENWHREELTPWQK